MTRTRRELDWRLKAIAARKRAEREFHASIHGLKLESDLSLDQENDNFTDEQNAKIDEVIKQAQERKRREYKK